MQVMLLINRFSCVVFFLFFYYDLGSISSFAKQDAQKNIKQREKRAGIK
jgi:hypothetical protein